MSNILQHLDRPIAFQRSFVTLTGSINAALMLSQAVYWHLRTDNKEGWFYKTQEQWEEETGLSRYEQESARKRLKELGFWEEKREGLPAKMFFRVNERLLQDQLEKLPHSSMRKTSRLVRGKAANRSGENQQTILGTETTTETTTENNTAIAVSAAPSADANVPDISPGKQSKPKRPKPEPDSRKDHWAIKTIRECTQRYPEKILWDDIIKATGEKDQSQKLTACIKVWLARGFNKNNSAGYINWFKNGIPEQRKPQLELNNGARREFVQ